MAILKKYKLRIISFSFNKITGRVTISLNVFKLVEVKSSKLKKYKLKSTYLKIKKESLKFSLKLKKLLLFFKINNKVKKTEPQVLAVLATSICCITATFTIAVVLKYDLHEVIRILVQLLEHRSLVCCAEGKTAQFKPPLSMFTELLDTYTEDPKTFIR